jgi:hypothetical protein
MNIESFMLPDSGDLQTLDQVEALIGAFNDHFTAYMPDYSFAHIVLSDFNLEDQHIRWCLKPAQIIFWREDRMKGWGMSRDECDQQEAVIKQFLNYLLTIPEAIREDQTHDAE